MHFLMKMLLNKKKIIACTNAYKKNCMQNIKSSWRQTKYHGKNNTSWT